MPLNERIAIVGMAGRFAHSGADLDQFWQAIANAQDCSRDVVAGQWAVPPERCFDPDGVKPDTVYSTRGYFLDAYEPDTQGLRFSADLITQLDPLFHLVFDVGNRAWKTANTEKTDPRKVGVILGNICLPTDKSNALCQQFMGTAYGLPKTSTLPLNRFVAGLPAGMLARGLGLGGGTFTLDAACASSLYAIKLAADELLSGRADAMLAGGCNRSDSMYTQMGFTQLRALSRSGKCSPFDEGADGLMVGEGAGIFVLKRLSDALAHDDTIHAVLHGWGLSNDIGANLLSPALEGQLRAMRAAYQRADWHPSTVDLIECHATGTPVGDAIEFESLCELWRITRRTRRTRCVLGSVKSTVGHLLTGAGAAAVMKVMLALKHKQRPAQTNFAMPSSRLAFHDSPFEVLKQTQPWEPESNRLRRAAVSGFGFGGVNAHLLFEEWPDAPEKPDDTTTEHLSVHEMRTLLRDLHKRENLESRSSTRSVETPIAIVGMSAHAGSFENLQQLQEYLFHGKIEGTAKPKKQGWQLIPQKCPPGHYIEEVTIPLDSFRIPPKELEEMLPQQLLILQAAANALRDCKAKPAEKTGDTQTGVFIGLGLDLNTSNYHLRWLVRDAVRQEAIAPIDLDRVTPALNANRVMGSLGSIAASRIARAFQFGGPSFTVCSEETSAMRALELAVRALRANEIDQAVVGSVDLTGDPRAVLPLGNKSVSQDGEAKPLCRHTHGMVPGEAAAAVILKRLDDAERDGDRIYAVIRGVGSASGGQLESSVTAPNAGTYATSMMRACSDAMVDPAQLQYWELAASGNPSEDRLESEALAALLRVTRSPRPLTLGNAKAQIGHTGFASGLIGLIKSSLALYQQILPAAMLPGALREELAPLADKVQFPSQPQYWLQDRSAGPRRAIVASVGVDGTTSHLILEEGPSQAVIPAEQSQPLGSRDVAIFVIEGQNPADLQDGLGRLYAWLPGQEAAIERLAREWFARVPLDSRRPYAVSLVARSVSQLKEQIDFVLRSLASNPEVPIPNRASLEARPQLRDQIFYSPYPMGRDGKLAFVYPGSGNQFASMGRDLGAEWPQVLRRQQLENERLRSQYAPDLFWQDSIPVSATPRDFLFAQVTLGTLTSDLLSLFDLKPDCLIGQSLGESAGLFGCRLWMSRDEMLDRLMKSSLFVSDLGPPYNSARRFYGISETEPFVWVSGIVAAPADEVRANLQTDKKAYLLIVTSPNECVIGGRDEDVRDLVAAIGKPYLPLNGVTLAHCEAGKPVEQPYRELHYLPVTPRPDFRVYSGAWGRSYTATEDLAADSITAGLLNTIDFPRVVEAAYRHGVRYFLEAGPGNSTSRMITATLGDRPHVARAVCVPRQDSVALVLRTLAHLLAERVPLSLQKLYGEATTCVAHQVVEYTSRRALVLPVGCTAKRPEFEGEIETMGTPVDHPEPMIPLKPSVAEHPLIPLSPTCAEQPLIPLTPLAPTLPLISTSDPTESDLELTLGDPVPETREVARTEYELTLSDAGENGEMAVDDENHAHDQVGDGLIIDPLEKAEELAREDVTALPGEPAKSLELQFSEPAPEPQRAFSTSVMDFVATSWSQFAETAVSQQQAASAAHAQYLKVQEGLTQTMIDALGVQSDLIRRLLGQEPEETENTPAATPMTAPSSPSGASPVPATRAAAPAPVPSGRTPAPIPMSELSRRNQVPRSLSFEDCHTFAIGKIGDVLGTAFAEVDQYPTRVRLPDFPLMLVDRILKIEGEPKSMTSGRVITEHTVHADRWYLDAGRCPTSITVESGQADLFLSGYLGIDFVTRGLAVYRLLDAVATFHRALPKIGERIEYDIYIDEFFHQADTWLFRFRFEATIDGQPLLSMKNGVAGFFTQQALAAGQGIIQTKLDRQPAPGKRPADWQDFVKPQPISLDSRAIDALRQGRLTDAFGSEFAIPESRMVRPLPLPDGMLRLVDRVPVLDPVGGRFSMGFIRAEYDIQPKEWFIECHFIDDKVMPGTLMYECCLHTLRILLMRIGWVGEEGQVVCEPVPEVGSRLKCRGQVLETTRTVTYEVSVKELGYGLEPFAIADALMYADDKPIVEITNLSLRMSGLTRGKIEELWTTSKPRKRARYDTDRILAYSNGLPSVAFGEPYKIFDHDRVIARLPGPPYQFLDQITEVTGEPFVLKAGASCTAEYEVPTDAWYFAANSCPVMPFSVLLEIALQPCGWLAAYCGSALTSPTDLSFRNLGGQAIQYQAVGSNTGTLTTQVKMTKVSQSVGMIIQHYDLLVTNARGKVYEGNTYFGFFSKDALRNQVGITNAKVPLLSPEQKAIAETGVLPRTPPFPAAMLRMVDQIEGYLPQGGQKQLGLVQGRIAVDPNAWFFKAHFYQDPVWPGSLGLESFLQLLKYVAWKKWGEPGCEGWQTVELGRSHSWVYRGQVLPTDQVVTVVLEVTDQDSEKRTLTASGFLIVDNRVIYQMSGFTLHC